MTLLNRPATIVWILLMLATCASTWWLRSDAVMAFATTALIMLIAGIKVRMVIIHFMELGNAPIPWRLFFEAWVVVVTAIIITGFWMGVR